MGYVRRHSREGLAVKPNQAATDASAMISRRLVVAALLLAFASLAFGPSALADHAAPPVVTLIAPSSGATVKLTSLAQDAPTFSWRVDYPTPPGRTVILSLNVSTDPTFASGGFNENRACDQANLACFTSLKATADWFRQADACLGTSRPPDCATRRPGAPFTFYWRVNVTWAGDHPQATATGSFTGQPVPDRDRDGILDPRDNCPTAANPDQRNSDGTRLGDACERDRTPPRVRVASATLTRGRWGRVNIHMGDTRSGVVKVDAGLYRGSRRFAHLAFTMGTVRFETTYFYRLFLPRIAPAGAYRVCIRVTDPSRNSTRRCARVRVR
jgi:hypothetical protein